MVEDETRRYKATKNYLDSVANLPPFDTSKFEVIAPFDVLLISFAYGLMFAF